MSEYPSNESNIIFTWLNSLYNPFKTQDLRKYKENLKTSQNYCQVLSPLLEVKILSVLVKITEKQKLNFSHSVLFHMKTRVCLKYFVNDCRYPVSNFEFIFSTSISNNCTLEQFSESVVFYGLKWKKNDQTILNQRNIRYQLPKTTDMQYKILEFSENRTYKFMVTYATKRMLQFNFLYDKILHLSTFWQVSIFFSNIAHLALVFIDATNLDEQSSIDSQNFKNRFL